MLAWLHLHYPLAIVSARGERTTYEFLDRFELTPYFKVIATAQTTPHTKPYPDPILWVARQMKVPPEACLMVGDTTVDIRAGKAAGAQTAAVLCGFGEEDGATPGWLKFNPRQSGPIDNNIACKSFN